MRVCVCLNDAVPIWTLFEWINSISIQFASNSILLLTLLLNYSQHVLSVYVFGYLTRANMFLLLFFFLDEEMEWVRINGSIACETNKHNQFHLLFFWPILLLLFAVSSISRLLIFILVLSVRLYFFIIFILCKCLLNRKFTQPRKKFNANDTQ